MRDPPVPIQRKRQTGRHQPLTQVVDMPGQATETAAEHVPVTVRYALQGLNSLLANKNN